MGFEFYRKWKIEDVKGVDQKLMVGLALNIAEIIQGLMKLLRLAVVVSTEFFEVIRGQLQMEGLWLRLHWNVYKVS